MKKLTALAILSFTLVSTSVLAEKLDKNDVVILKDMTLYSALSENETGYKGQKTYEAQKNSNIIRLNETIKDNPELESLLLPVIGYLEEHDDINSAKKDLSSLLINLSKEVD